jgi:glycosyltransferase involved in cell wall biosynthesis
MDFAVINESTKYTGLGRYAIDISSATNAKLFSINIDSSITSSKYPGQIVSYERLIKFGNGWYMSHRYPRFFLAKIASKIKYEISHDTIVHYASQTIPHLNLNNRYIYTVHDVFGLDPTYQHAARLRNLLKLNFKYIASGERIVTTSHYIKSKLLNLGINEKIEVIYPAISRSFKRLDDRIKARKLLGLPENKKLILSVSSKDPRKNLKVVANTMQYLDDEYKLVRVGQPIGNCFSFTDIDDEKLNMIYNASDVLLFPSLEEGFGYPLAEAMTVGLPVVASNIPVFHEIAGDSAVLIESDPKTLAQGVKDAINNWDIYRQKGIEMAKRYSFERFREYINHFYRSIGD